MNIQKQMQKIKGTKLLRQMSAKAKREYARLREIVRKSGSKPAHKVGLWSVSFDPATRKRVFKNKGTTLLGISPSEFALFQKKLKTTKRAVQTKKRARA